MKKLAVIASLALLSPLAMAENYVAGGVGVGHVSYDCTGAISCDKSSTAFKLLGGYGLTDHVSIELGYISFGKVKGAVMDPNYGVVNLEGKVTAFTLAAAAKAALAPSLFGHIRVGLANVKTEISGSLLGVSVNAGSETKVKPYLGLGLSLPVNKQLSVTADLDMSRGYDGADTYSVRALTVGLRGAF